MLGGEILTIAWVFKVVLDSFLEDLDGLINNDKS